VIIDTGVAGSAGRIDDVLRASGLSWPAVQAVILTHHHGDHQGSAADVFYYAPLAELYAGEADVERINTANLNRQVLPAREGSDIYGVRVIGTPGHTLGHISLLDEELGTLFVGDAVFNTNNTLSASPPQNTADMAMANETVRKLGGLGFERAMFGHGDPIEGGAAAAFAALGATLP
jgi:glyoxylase-like metal-dependent hydrolase (beta-lactamase superfamily II)